MKYTTLPSNVLKHFINSEDIKNQLQKLTIDRYGEEAYNAFLTIAEIFQITQTVDQGRLGLINSRNHARLVKTPDNRTAILKLTCVPCGDENSALLAWQKQPLARKITAQIYDYGEIHNGWQWSLQEKLPGKTHKVTDGNKIYPQIPKIIQQLTTPKQGFPNHAERLITVLSTMPNHLTTQTIKTTTETIHQLYELDNPTHMVHGDLGQTIS